MSPFKPRIGNPSPAERSAAAGAENLRRWKEKNPAGGALTHGGRSAHTRRRWSDKRTREGRELHKVIQGLADDLGGMQNLSAGQVLILDRIREKIIVVMQIGKFVDGLRGIITKDGGIIPALGKNYMSFSEGLRRDLQAFYEMADRRPSKVPDLASYLKQKAEEKKRAGGGNGPERVQDGPRTEIPGPEGKDEPVDVEEEQPGEDGEA